MTSTILSLLDKRTAEEFHRRGDWGDRTIYGVIRDQAIAQPNANAVDKGQRVPEATVVEDIYRWTESAGLHGKPKDDG